MTYNEIIQQAGKRIKIKVHYIQNNTTTNVDESNIESAKIFFKSDILGTAIKGCELVLKEKIDGKIYIQIEAKYQTYTDTKTYGPFYLKEEPEYDANTKKYTHKLYDELIKAMVDYEPLEVTYPITIFNFFTALTTELGYTNNIAFLPNGTKTIKSDIYNNIGFTYRDVLDDIAVANGVLFYIDNNEIKQVSRGTNTITIDDDILKNSNINFGEHFGPINSIVLSRGGEGDNVFIKDDQSIAQYGLHEFKIIDNQLMNENDRAEYLPLLSLQLFGIEYDIYDTELVGYGDIGIQNEVEFETGDNEYTSYIFNNEINVKNGYKQTIYCDTPIESETDYKSASETDKTINQAYIIARKAEAEVEILATKVVDVSKTIKGTNQIQLDNAYEGGLHKLIISGSMSLLYPSSTQYPKSTLYPLSSVLLVDDVEYELDLDYLNYYSATVYDEFVYEEGNCKIIRRVGNNNGTLYPLDNEVEEERNFISINVKKNSIIKLKSFPSMTYECEYLLDNKYTDVFTNKVEVKSSINLLGDEIESKVSANDVVSTINQSPEEIRITGNRFVVEANNFSLDKIGNIMSKSGTIGNWTITESALYCLIRPDYDYTQSDVDRVRQLVLGQITPTNDDYLKYDFDKSGAFNANDLLVVNKLVVYNIGNTHPGKLLLDTTDWFKPIKIIGGNGDVLAWFGPNGVGTKNIE